MEGREKIKDQIANHKTSGKSNTTRGFPPRIDITSAIAVEPDEENNIGDTYL